MTSITYFEIQAKQPELLIDFYQSVFGWKFIPVPEIPIPYWRIETDGIHGGLLQRPASTPPPECGTNAYVCSMLVEDVEAVTAVVLSKGGIVAMPKFAVAGAGWHGYFLDPDGNTFGVFQPDPLAA